MNEPTENSPTENSPAEQSEATANSPAEQPEPPRKWYRSANTSAFAAVVFGIATVGLIVLVVVQAVELHQRYPLTNWGNVPEAFAGAGTVLAVAVALWQSIVIRRQAVQEATDTADRFEKELRSARDLHDAEMKAADARHKAELESQREIARVQRLNAREQEFKRALIQVQRAISAYTQELATLVAETPRIVTLTTRQERDDAFKPITKIVSALGKDLAAEISGAHMLTNNDELHDAINHVTAAALKSPPAQNTFLITAIWQSQVPNEAPIFMLMEELHRSIGDARTLAARLLVTGWQ